MRKLAMVVDVYTAFAVLTESVISLYCYSSYTVEWDVDAVALPRGSTHRP